MSLDAGVVHETLDALGISVRAVSGQEYQALCPAHKDRTGREDRRPSWFINSASGRHICFSCGFKGGLEYLVAYLKGYEGPEDATRFIRRHDQALDESAIRARVQTALDRNGSAPRRDVLSESRLALFTDPPQWALDERRISREACQLYGVLWDTERQAWIIPLRYAEDNLLMGWQEKGQGGLRYFRNQPRMVRKSQTFFGWEQSLPLEQVIIVESPLDVVRLASVGIPGGIAVCGSTMSKQQYHLLGESRVIAAFDNPKVDQAGARAAKELLSRSCRLAFSCRFFAYGDSRKKDIGEMSAAAIRRGIMAAQSPTLHGIRAIYA